MPPHGYPLTTLLVEALHRRTTLPRKRQLIPDSEISVDGIAKRMDAQGFALTKPLFKEIPVRQRKTLSAGPLKQDRRANFGIPI